MNKIIPFLLLMLPVLSFGQFTDEQVKAFIATASEEDLVKENSRLMKEGFFYQAEMVVDKLITFQPENPNYNYRKGFLALEIRRDYLTALPYLEKAIKDTRPHFDAFSSKEQSAPADAFYHLAECYHFNQEFDKAIQNYDQFINSTYGKSELIEKAKMKKKQCELAKQLIASPVNVRLINLGSAVNSQYPDYSPVISLDGSALYFTSRRPWENKETEGMRDPVLNQYPEDVFVSYLDFDGSWTEAMKLDFCIPKRNEATIAVSSDERRIFLYEDSTGSGDIYYSDFYAQKFHDIQLLNIKDLNSPYWETHCMLTPDKMRLFFASDRPGGFGGRDLYVINRLSDTTWSKPINLGPTINSPFDEDAPFVSIDNKRLYFSSNGERSIGGFDILYSDLTAEGAWGEPKNIGYPFNSTNDDIYYTTTIDGLKGYLTSFRNDGKGEKDIYEVNNDFLGVKALAVLKGLIRTRDNSPLPEDLAITMKLECKDCEEGEPVRTIYPRLRDGGFVSDLKPCKSYVLTYVDADRNNVMYTDEFTTKCDTAYQEIYREMVLDVENRTMYPVRRYALEGTVADRQTGEKISGATVTVKDLNTGAIIETVTADQDGNFKLAVLKDKQTGDRVNLDIQISKEGYIAQSFEFKETLAERENISLNYLLEKAVVGTDLGDLFKINNIYFDFDKFNIRPDAKKELDKIVKIMNANPTMEIELGSHTDCRGTYEYNMKLSERRAKASADYIKARITNPERIYGKGYGEHQLVNNCPCEGEVTSSCAPSEHQANRRTEFRIVKR